MQIYQMDAMNFHFVAHPNAWVVHRPHAPSSGYNHTFTGEAYTLKHKPTDHLWKMERIAKVSFLLSLHPDLAPVSRQVQSGDRSFLLQLLQIRVSLSAVHVLRQASPAAVCECLHKLLTGHAVRLHVTDMVIAAFRT